LDGAEETSNVEPIRSRTSTERIVRATALAALINGFASAFLWDGHVGYVRENARQLAELLGRPEGTLPPIDPNLTASEAQQRMQQIQPRSNRAAVQSVLGSPGLEDADRTYYLGPGGHVRVAWDRDQVAGIEWVDGIHSETTLAFQRWLGYGLSVLGLIYLVHFFRVITFRASLTEAGLSLSAKSTVPFDAMQSLRPSDTSRGQQLELAYSPDGREAVLRLDPYVIKELPAIVSAICARKGFPHPLMPDEGGSDHASGGGNTAE
jgi:hypothetical protein